MNAHTPGPWHIGMRPGPIVYGPNGEQVASLLNPLVGDSENKANARLISAAPDLLSTLESCIAAGSMIQQGKRGGEVMGQLSAAIDQAREAIAKARGVA